MNVEAYLTRIGFECQSDDFPPPTLETLSKLQRLHQIAIPWENLDVVTGEPIDLNLETLYSKIVEQSRGGWCHELNGLYSWLLEQLGFEVTLLSCRFWFMGSWNREGDHMLLLVKIPNQSGGDHTYLSDVGWGEMRAFVEPLLLEHERVSTQDNGHYRLTKDQELTEWTLFHQKIGEFNANTWVQCCKFSLTPWTFANFQEITSIYANGLDEKVLILKELPIVMKKSGSGSEANIVIGDANLHFQKIGHVSRRMKAQDLPLSSAREFSQLLDRLFGIRVNETLAANVIQQIQRSGELMNALSGETSSSMNEVLI